MVINGTVISPVFTALKEKLSNEARYGKDFERGGNGQMSTVTTLTRWAKE